MTAALIDISPRADLAVPRTGSAAGSVTPGTGFDEAISDAVDRTRPERREERPRRDRTDRDADRAAESGLTAAQVDGQQTSRTAHRGSTYDASHHVVTRRVAGAGEPGGTADPAKATVADQRAGQGHATGATPRATSLSTPARAVDGEDRTAGGRHGTDTRHTRTDGPHGAESTIQRGDAPEPDGMTGAGAKPGPGTPSTAPGAAATREPAPRHRVAHSDPGATAIARGDRASASAVTDGHSTGMSPLAAADQAGTRPRGAVQGAAQPTGLEVTAVPTVTGSTTNSTPISAPNPVAAPPLPIAQPDIAGILGQLRGRADGTYQLRAMVHPAELGAVNITATISHGSVSVLLHGDAQAQHTLSQSLSQLRDHLADQGFTGVDVGLGSPDQHAQDGDRSDEYRTQGSDHHVGNTADVTDDEVTAIRRRHAGAIDAML